MKKTAATITLLAIAFSFRLNGAELVRESRHPELWDRVLAVPKADFTAEGLESQFRAILKADLGKAKVMQVEVRADREAAGSGNCKCVTDVSYALWHDLYAAYRPRMGAVAVLTIIGNSAAMRVRGEDGKVTKKILSGHDPTVVEAAGHRADILHVVRYSAWVPGGTRETRLVFFLRTEKPPEIAAAAALARMLRQQLDFDKVRLDIRQDSWFITDDQFPVVYNFEQIFQPPSLAEYESTPQIACVPEKGDFRCYEWQPRGRLKD